MTRINCIEPERLTDQHLMAEYRELPRVFALARPLADSEKVLTYRMGTGHVRFFYDKTGYLSRRQGEIIEECRRRGIQISHTAAPNPVSGLESDWEPTDDDRERNLVRLRSKLGAKPGWYRYEGKPVSADFYGEEE